MTETSAQSFEGHLERGDLHAAADWLVRAHGRDVLHLCTTIVRDRGTAEDLAQDAFGKAFLALPEFRGEASARTAARGASRRIFETPSRSSASETRARSNRC